MTSRKVTEVTLDGNLPNQNYEHPSMVAFALVSNPQETDGRLEILSIYLLTTSDTEKKIDETRLAKGKYKISIIFASSKNGATFEGAPGSTLLSR